MDRDHNEAQRTKRIGPTQADPANPSGKRGVVRVVITRGMGRQVVVIKFGPPINSLELTPEEACDMVAALGRQALELGLCFSSVEVTAHEGQRKVERDDPAE